MIESADTCIDSILDTFDQIYEDFKSGVCEIQLLKARYDAETQRSESLEEACNSLGQDNERLSKLYTQSLNHTADMIDLRTRCQKLEDELRKVKEKNVIREVEYNSKIELLKHDYIVKIADLEEKIREVVVEGAASEATINRLNKELVTQKAHAEQLVREMSKDLNRACIHVESKYITQIQDLKECLSAEQEEKKELSCRCQTLEKELLMMKTNSLAERREMASPQQVETLKQKIMRLRKENEILRRKASSSAEN